MSARSGIPLVLALAAATLLAAAAPARAELAYDTLYVANSLCQPPAIAIDGTGVVHVMVPEDVGHRHFWRAGGGPWQQEVITPAINTSYVTLAVGPTDRLALLRRGAAGNLIVLRPGQQAFWDADTIPAPPTPSGSFSALQLDPSTDEPLVAFVTNSGGFFRLTLARRSQAGWFVTTVDSTPQSMSQPSLALDPAGRIRLALGRNVGPANQAGGFYYAEADDMTGPFTWTLVDPNLIAINSALQLDPATGEPRVTFGKTLGLAYASRSGGEWTSGPVYDEDFIGNSFRPLSLTLDAAGLPHILESYLINVLTTSSSAADPNCGGVNTPYIVHFSRDHATGPGTFDFTHELGNIHESGGDALATFGPTMHIVWRKSWNFQCWPAPILYTQISSPVGVAPGVVRISTLRIAPNPVREGNVLHVRMSLAVDGPVALHLTDVAGRSVARIHHDGLRGDGEVRWTLPKLAAGWYQVRAKQGDIVLGSAPLLIVD